MEELMSRLKLSGLKQERIDKLTTLREKGIDPYPARVSRTHTIAQALNLPLDETGVITGRVMAIRSFGKACFINIKDGSGKIQLYFRGDNIGEGYGLLSAIDIGDFISAKGKLFNTKTGEKTLAVEEFSFISKSLSPLPEKWHGLSDIEKRYRQRYLDLISNPRVSQAFSSNGGILLSPPEPIFIARQRMSAR